MGLLSQGTPFDWPDVKPHADHIRKHGIKQFLNIWNRVKVRRMDAMLWGEELEYIVVDTDKGQRTVKLSLRAEQVLSSLQQVENNDIKTKSGMINNRGTSDSSWKPEYARYMIEGTPGSPYGPTLRDLLLVEENMRQRRKLATGFLLDSEEIVTMTNFPLLGAPNCFLPNSSPNPTKGASMSLFISDEAITKHVRFPTLTANIRKRRGEKVAINLPIFVDKNTPRPFREPLPPAVVEQNLAKAASTLPDYESNAKEDHVYLDAMCFGMGCSCLQVTIQACTVEAGRRLYDHLTVMTPIMLCLSACAPIFRGYLVDVDCRWEVIAGSVDDRTKQERGLEPLTTDKFVIPKSRYESVSRYLSPGPNVSGTCATMPDFNKEAEGSLYYKSEYNDLPEIYDEQIYQQLIDGGVDELLAKHYAHLFIRDPLVVFSEMLNIDDEHNGDHFENIQSTNWQTMRFKPPPVGSDIGWRVEFRSMDIQLTDSENAAFSVFIVLLVRTMLHYKLNLYIPLSKVDDNMNKARLANAVLEQKFWFRKDISPEGSNQYESVQDEYQLCTINEIMNGTGQMPGICTLIDSYLDAQDVDESTRAKLKSQVNLVRQRSTGERQTGATWIRNFVRKHPAYKFDSVVTPEINYDLFTAIKALNGDFVNK